MAKVNPIQLQKHLKGLTYPASKQDIVTKAQANGADESLCNVLEALPDKAYGKPTEVTAAVKNVSND